MVDSVRKKNGKSGVRKRRGNSKDRNKFGVETTEIAEIAAHALSMDCLRGLGTTGESREILLIISSLLFYILYYVIRNPSKLSTKYIHYVNILY